ncbi:hypothetical protein, partial [Flavobacterium cupreum]
MIIALFVVRYGQRLPQSMVDRLKQLSSEFKELMILGDKMIPEALKELHAKLDHIRKIIHAGGVPPHDTATTLLAQTGQKVISYAEEARLIETGA